MKKIITTLPITPRSNPCLKLLVQPFIMDVLSKKLGFEKVLSLNMNGWKSCDKEVIVEDYLNSNKQLGIEPNFVWRDDFAKNRSLVKNLIKELILSGYITQEETEIMRCPCKTVESLAEADNISSTRKRYVNNKCLVCNQEISKSLESALLFRFPQEIQYLPMQIFPKFYEKEIRHMAKRFSGYKFLISRSRPSSFSLTIYGDNIFLDVDFVWQLFLSILYRTGNEIGILVGANRNLMACLFVSTLFHILDNKQVTTIIPPFYLATNRQKLSNPQHSLSSLLTNNSSKAVRLLLATAMNWRRKESIIDFRFLELIQKVAYRIYSSPQNNSSVEEIVHTFNEQTIRSLLAQARKKREPFRFKELHGII